MLVVQDKKTHMILSRYLTCKGNTCVHFIQFEVFYLHDYANCSTKTRLYNSI